MLKIYNTLSRRKEEFKPIKPPHVGMYVCGPTVYGDAHLGHARAAITFDLLYRYLKHLEYKVRYVRNITDVGHLENDADSGEDKIGKRARLEELEPMEIVQRYTNGYHHNMEQLNTLPPDIEPHASGHIIEQQLFTEKILKHGYAYESNGSVYFDVEKYNHDYHYGKLSGRKLEDLISNTRNLEGQEEKRHPYDFALWKKATPGHIMKWPSRWSEGYPGWHIECSTMSTKYLGDSFDIHGGGMDLLFPHHECEIAQSTAALGKESVRYWMHNNLISINGQKMGKSLGNAISLNELFSGDHKLLEKAYSPMAIRFFILQAHYRSTLNFSNRAIQASERGLERLFEGMETLEKIKAAATSTYDPEELNKKCLEALDDDLNTPVLISHLFEGVKQIHLIASGKGNLTAEDLAKMKKFFATFVYDILGLKQEEKPAQESVADDLIRLILDIRMEAKKKKDFETADKIRNMLSGLGIVVKDVPGGYEWEHK
ncbi:MAG: cysteine--tRNA ligase [Bacteroidales bacterium]|nr:cysteine--tRNA ligase [Bacteroidales bacterium]